MIRYLHADIAGIFPRSHGSKQPPRVQDEDPAVRHAPARFTMLRLRPLSVLLLLILLSGTSRAMQAMATYEPVPADRMEERFQLAEKVGWYQLDDGSSRWMTWSTDGGLTLNDFSERESLRLRPVSDEVFTARNGTGQEYEVQFQRDGSGEITGFRWVDAQGGERTAHRIEAAPYQQKEITYQNRAVDLVGLLITPAQQGPHPAVVYLSGGSEGARDDLWYLYQADHLARHGIAVFLPDTRGSGKSRGEWETASFDDLAGDATAAVQRLKLENGIDPERIGVIGVGEGGWTAPVATVRSDDVRFLVAVSPTAVSPRAEMRHEISSDVRRYGTPDFLVPLIAFALEFRSTHRDEEWWETNGRFDPMPYWERLSRPALVVYGSEDATAGLPVRRSIERLDEARRTSGNAQFTIRLLEEADLKMEDSETGRIRDDYLELLTGWIMTQAA